MLVMLAMLEMLEMLENARNAGMPVAAKVPRQLKQIEWGLSCSLVGSFQEEAAKAIETETNRDLQTYSVCVVIT